MVMFLVPTAPLQSLLLAETVLAPGEVQVMVMVLLVDEPVPPPTLQLQPLAFGVQLLAEAVKV